MTFIPKKIHLLYIEDFELMHNIINKFLQKTHLDFNIISKKNLTEGIDYIQNKIEEIDIILLDLNLPNSHGINTFKKLYKVVGTKCPIVIVSGYEENACKCVKLGAQDYLIKTDLTSNLLYRSLKYSIERNNIKNQLALTNNKYIELVEATNACIYEIDLEKMKLTYVNKNFINLLGYTQDEILNLNLKSIVTDKSFQIFKNRIKKLRNGEHIEQTVEYQLRCKDGTIVWVLNTSKFYENKDHDVIKIVGVTINITEQKLAQQILKDKEKIAFEYLNDKIQEWNEELKNKDLESQNYLQTINQQILTL